MRPFACTNCHALVHFPNSECVTCGHRLGFDRRAHALVALADDGTLTRADGSTAYPCANRELAACNWLADAPGALCGCCELTRTRPSDDDHEGLAAFARTEFAKRRLVYQLDDLGLPTTPRTADPGHGLAFDLLSSADGPVTTGHADGVITLDLAEGNDSHREAMREQLGEPYRTLLGHLRHEIGHWYWQVLVASDDDRLARFRALFGDDRADYAEALRTHYDRLGDSSDWTTDHVSAYAAAHPWEDWAETFAHYLHIRDTLQTAAGYGMKVAGPDIAVRCAAPLSAEPSDEHDDFDTIIADWVPVSLALNAVNRSMGKDDLYPFVLTEVVLRKLRLVHALVAGQATASSRRPSAGSTGASDS
ncbi:MAG: zinc-binding metallopeptidase family protein [Jatrophihabitans sp.]|uniref:zinc-binding metallopeptidase family protein n=1 Tax=Jatrophihabitans sp. TaxID=1932789 RepID=UPI003F7EC98A